MQWRRWGSNPQPFGLESSTLPLSHCAPFQLQCDRWTIYNAFEPQKVWPSPVGKAPSCAPKLCSIPPTSESFGVNVKRTHLQACVWKQDTVLDPPEFNPIDYRWEKNVATKPLSPVMLPKNNKLGPPEVLQLIKCSCGRESLFGTLRCRRNSALLSCTIFCACQGGVLCSNEQTKHT